MRNICLLVVTMLVIGCGGGSGNVPDGATGQCNPTASCVSCVKQSCDSLAKVVFGAGYQSGNYSGGACPNFFACTCNATGKEQACAQADGPNCVTAFDALGACLDASACFDTACKTTSSIGLTVNGNAMDFGPTEVGTTQSRCMLVTGPNASTISPQILNDIGCAAGGCAFSTQPLYCRAPDSCDACVAFTPKYVGAVSATLSIASGINVALSGIGIASTLPGTGGTIIVPGTGGIVGFGGAIGTGGTTSTVDANIGTGGNISVDGSVGTGGSTVVIGKGGNIGSGGIIGTGGGIIIVVGVGGNIGTGGITGAGGTTVDASGPACPLGIWIADSGSSACGGVNVTMETTIAQATSGEYIAVAVFDPMKIRNVLTGETSCGPMTVAGLAVSYVGNLFKFSFGLDTATCPEKMTTITLTIDQACENADVEMVTTNCLSCASDGSGSGCGSVTCSMPSMEAVRSL
jgi:hypothetical protein